MASFIDRYEYDIFISYRQNDNIYDGWVTQFVENLQKELVATIKVNISVYFDENPHDGLLENHQVDESLDRKLNCLIFIPIISQTYCDTTSFAWQHEFLVFKEKAAKDELGMHITLPNGNVSNRILPIRIHNLDEADQALLEKELGGTLRSIDFIHQAPGVNRPLDATLDGSYGGPNQVVYRDQINKVANSIKEILIGIKNKEEPIRRPDGAIPRKQSSEGNQPKAQQQNLGKSIWRRNIPQVVLVYAAVALILYRLLQSLISYFSWPEWILSIGLAGLALGSIVAIALAWTYEFGPEGLIRTSTWKSRLNPYPGNKKKPFTGAATIITLVAVIVLQIFYFKYYPTGKNTRYEFSSIAVLPFENLNQSDSNKYLCEGLSENISILLSQVANLRVISPASTKKYNSGPYNIENIGKDLDVDVVVLTSMVNNGEDIQLNCQLVDTQSSYLIGGESLNIEIDSLWNLGGKLSSLIIDKLSVDLSSIEEENMRKLATRSNEAYDHYLRGRNLYYSYQQEAMDSAIIEFKKAIELDREYVLAWAGLADAYSQLNYLFGYDIAWNDSSIRVAEHAISLDSTSSEAYKALGNAYYYTNRYKKAMVYFKKSLAISPSNAQAAGNLGSIYFTQGDFYNSLVWQLRSAELNPSNFIAPVMAGWSYRLLGNYSMAEKWLLRSISIRPYADTYRELGYTYVLQNQPQQAVDLMSEIMALDSSARNCEQAGLIALFANSEDNARYYLGEALRKNPDLRADQNSIVPMAQAYFLIKDNKPEEAKNELARLENFYIELILKGSEDDEPRIHLAGIKNMQGDDLGAITWFRRALKEGYSELDKLERVPWLNPLTNHPDYASTVEDLKARLSEMSQKAESLEDK